MKLAISNIAWKPDDASAAYRIMEKRGARGLEIAPGLSFPGESDPFAPSDAVVKALVADLSAYGISMVSMQSLLFGISDARLFGDINARQRFRSAMIRAIWLAERLEIGNLVFGSPANRRYPDHISEREAEEQAMEVFNHLGDVARSAGTTLAIEPNPAAYGTNFLTTVASTARFVTRVDHPAVRLNFDVGAMIMNDERDLEVLIAASRDRISHVHLSEPQLAPAPADVDHAKGIVVALSQAGYGNWFSIEMRSPTDDGLAVVDAALGKGAEAVALCGASLDA